MQGSCTSRAPNLQLRSVPVACHRVGVVHDLLSRRTRAQRAAFDGRLARAVRLAAGATQDEIARELGVHRVSVARWEIGTRKPSGDLLRRYLALLVELQGGAASA
jgi:DNA-binding transcriptional regulator YiaG